MKIILALLTLTLCSCASYMEHTSATGQRSRHLALVASNAQSVHLSRDGDLTIVGLDQARPAQAVIGAWSMFNLGKQGISAVDNLGAKAIAK